MCHGVIWMEETYKNVRKSLRHLEILHEIFWKRSRTDYPEYRELYKKLSTILDAYDFDYYFYDDDYSSGTRQMILADILEYVFTGRGYYAIGRRKEDLGQYLRIIMYFVNLLMCYESMTVDSKTRTEFLGRIEQARLVPDEDSESVFNALKTHRGPIGLPQQYDDEVDKSIASSVLRKLGEPDSSSGRTNARLEMSDYFDSILPKTAGGLWHELLVFIFLLRSKLGHVIPLLLSQRLFHGSGNHLVPPDFLVIANDKQIVGIEVGIKKEIQSGTFALSTYIPTAAVDTRNSRTSDRCPICKKWILLCDHVINNYSNLENEIGNEEVRCLEECTIFRTKDDQVDRKRILKGECPFTKFRTTRRKTWDYTHHEYMKLHYHYRCVLDKLKNKQYCKQCKTNHDYLKDVSSGKDPKALKTHYPYYRGLDALME